MRKCYLGIDIGSISIKGVIIDENEKIIARSYLYINNSLIDSLKELINKLSEQINLSENQIVSIGTTGLARKLVGSMLGASVIKNEIIAHATGTLSIFPNVRTIFEIGGRDSKIILLDNKEIIDYEINTLCLFGVGSFLEREAMKLDLSIEEFGVLALNSQKVLDLTGINKRLLFNEFNSNDKIKAGYNKEDIIAGICNLVVDAYLNSVVKERKLKSPIVFQGGVSKNIGIIKAIEEAVGEEIMVDENSHLLAALGVAILAKESKKERTFSFDIENIKFIDKEMKKNLC